MLIVAVVAHFDFAAAEIDEVARRQRDLQAPHVGAGRAVLERARARGVGRHRASHEATPLGRVGRVQQPLGLDRALKVREHDAHLDGRATAAVVVPDDPPCAVEPVRREHDPALRHAPADDPRARARDCDGRAFAARARERRHHLFGALRDEDARGVAAREVARVGEEGLDFVLLGFDEHEVSPTGIECGGHVRFVSRAVAVAVGQTRAAAKGCARRRRSRRPPRPPGRFRPRNSKPSFSSTRRDAWFSMSVSAMTSSNPTCSKP